MENRVQEQLERKRVELLALLEITNSINNNLSEESLYKIFKFTAISNLRLTRLCLLVQEEHWVPKAYHGPKRSLQGLTPGPELTNLKAIAKIQDLQHIDPFSDFDFVTPVWHQDRLLALIFTSGEDQLESQFEAMNFLQAMGNIVMVAMQNKRLQAREMEQEVFRREMEIARDVQRMLFPVGLPRVGRVVIEANYLPHDLVGGDYYDYVELDSDHFLLSIADVSGKGVGAAMMMSNFQASLRTLLRQTHDLPEIIRTLNDQVMDTARGEKFITCFLALYDLSHRTLSWVNAGHNPPLLWTPDKHVRMLEDGCTVLGAVRQLPTLASGRITALDDFLLFCYTDGLTETIREDGQEFGLQPIIRRLEKSEHPDPARLHQDLIIELDGFKGRNAYRDDITLLSCRVRNRIHP